MPRIVRCGLIQTSCDWSPEKIPLNQIKKKMIDKHLRLIDQAGRRKVQILCMQEIFSTPYFCAEQDTKWYATAEPIPGPTTKLMQRYARKHRLRQCQQKRYHRSWRLRFHLRDSVHCHSQHQLCPGHQYHWGRCR